MRFLSSVKSLYAAVVILFLTIGLGSYVDLRNEGMHAEHLEINTGLERMVRLNKELTSMLVIAVLKNSALGTASYDTVKNDLDQTMKTVIDLTSKQNSQQEVASVSNSQVQLREMEGRAREFINSENWDGAHAILFGDDYMLTTKTYEVDSESAVSAVMSDLATTSTRFARIRNVALGLRIGALLLLIWIGVMFSRKVRADLAEQMRLRDEITEAYDAMEARVRERTADLEESGKKLALENEERVKSDSRTRLILNSAGEGIFGLDAEERGTFFNDAAAKLLGYSADEMGGREIHSLIHHSLADGTPLAPEDCPMHVACVTGKSAKVSNEVLWRKDGSWFFGDYSVTPIVDDKGGAAGAVVVFRDISEQRKNQEELQMRMGELERFNRLTMGREERMIQLKQEINTLLEAQGAKKRYKDLDAES
ncbi:MAG: PAS domain S-box protein [Rhodocyclaceae bacterium]|nr:MAG: PAS domain S-box protein [Rhodocyclaceae bacterium]